MAAGMGVRMGVRMWHVARHCRCVLSLWHGEVAGQLSVAVSDRTR